MIVHVSVARRPCYGRSVNLHTLIGVQATYVRAYKLHIDYAKDRGEGRLDGDCQGTHKIEADHHRRKDSVSLAPFSILYSRLNQSSIWIL